MRFFTMLDFQYMMLAYFCGLGLLILVYIAWAGYPPRSDKHDADDPEKWEESTMEGDHDGERNPVVPFLLFVYAGIAIWAVSYMVVIGLRGPAF